MKRGGVTGTGVDSLGSTTFAWRFFHADLDEDLCLSLPEGLAPEGYVGQLKRAIYGTRKASRLFQDFVMKTCAAVAYLRLTGHPALLDSKREDPLGALHGDDGSNQ